MCPQENCKGRVELQATRGPIHASLTLDAAIFYFRGI